MPIEDLRELLAEQSLTFLAGIPYVYHCHHYNLFHDQTIDDALGEAEGARVRTTAAHNAFRELLGAVFAASGATTPAERISLAAEVFAWMGQGRISLDELKLPGSLTPDQVQRLEETACKILGVKQLSL